MVDGSAVYTYFKFSLDATAHNDYGVAYPITYQFILPASSANLKVYKKYNTADSWTQITEKTSSDFFNGIEAVRFDYANNIAYISAAFSDSSDNIYIKITNNTGTTVSANYQGITNYYDNRAATVTVTGDDWEGTHGADFLNALSALRSREIWFTPAIITHGPPPIDWSQVQSALDAGSYLEIASHGEDPISSDFYKTTGAHTGADNQSQTMTDSVASFPGRLIGAVIDNTTDGSSCTITALTDTTITCSTGLSGGTDNDWDSGDSYSIDRYDEEIGGSRDEIINNLNLPALNKKGSQEYVYAWIETAGVSDSTERAKLGQYKYLSDRTVGFADSFATWDSTNGVFNRVGTSYTWNGGTLTGANTKFDSVVAAGGIYHLWGHPWEVSWSPGSWILDHLDHIKQKTNLWYVGFGHLYLYHYIATQNKVGVDKISITAPTVTAQLASGILTDGATLNATITATGGENASTRGFKYYQSSNCTGAENIKSENGNFGVEAYSSNLTGLLPGISYSYKAYATNSVATGASTTCETFVVSTSTPAPTPPTPVPKLPNTGIAPSQNSIPWYIVILSGIFAVSILIYVTRRKRTANTHN